MFAEEEQSFLGKYLPYYASAGYTVFLAFIGVLFGAVLGHLGLDETGENKFLKIIATIYVEYVRGSFWSNFYRLFRYQSWVSICLSWLPAVSPLLLNSAAYVAKSSGPE